MNRREQTADDPIAQMLVDEVTNKLDRGMPKESIAQWLNDEGVQPVRTSSQRVTMAYHEAVGFVTEVDRLRRRGKRRGAMAQFAGGAVLLTIAAGITYWSWSRAEPGDTYWVASGVGSVGALALLAGTFNFLTSGRLTDALKARLMGKVQRIGDKLNRSEPVG